MRQTVQAKFENFDTAEAAAFAVRKQLDTAEILSVFPEHPESIELTHPHPIRFTLLPTAVASQHYITALVETEYNYEDLNEIQKRQTSIVQLLCDDAVIPEAHKIITARGGTILPPS